MTPGHTRTTVPFLAVLVALFSWGCATHTPLVGCEPVEGTTPVCGFQNPEDLVALDDDWLLISQMELAESPGNLIAFRPSDGRKVVLWPEPEGASADPFGTECAPPEAAVFAPHGIDLSRDASTLWVVNHGGREAVELFRIGRRDDAPTLTWVDCVPFDGSFLLNDVASLPGGRFVATEMVGQSAIAPLGIVLGLDTGRVWEWTPTGGTRVIPGSEGEAPNGIAASPDGETIYFAEWGAEQLVAIARDGSGRRSVALGFHPDNLSWAPDGRIVAGGQIAGPLEATGCFDLTEGGCSLPSAVAAIEPGSLAVERIWTHDPATAAGGISAALVRGDVIWLGAFGGDRLAWIPAP